VDQNTEYATPLSGAYVYSYDRDRRLTGIAFPSGKTLENFYDKDQLVQTRLPEGNIDYYYAPCGSKLESAVRGGESVFYEYDGPLVTSATYGGSLNETLSYGYDNDFRIASFGYAGETVGYAYDDDGQLVGAGAFDITRNAQNALPEAVSDGTGALARTFNEYGEVAAWTLDAGGTRVGDFAVGRGADGLITSRTETVAGVTHEYGYVNDDLGRLTTVTRDGAVVESYAYGGPHNARTLETNELRGIADWAFSYDDEDRLLTAGDAAYEYDADGFLTAKTVGAEVTRYQYSVRGELLRVDLPDGSVVEYAHDPLGRRVSKSVNGTVVERYLWQGLTQLLAVYGGDGSLKMRFDYADGRLPASMSVGGERYYPVYDQVGSLLAVVDGSGAALKVVEYDGFGNVIADSNESFEVPFGFAGGLYDKDAKLVRFGHRDYDPDTGRWTAKDPILFEGGDTDLYGYVLNDPVNWVDPEGLSAGVMPFPGLPMPIHPGFIPGTPENDAAVDALEKLAPYLDPGPLADWLWDKLNPPASPDGQGEGNACPTFNAAEHTKKSRPSTKNDHEKGQKRKNQKYNDKKRSKPGWKDFNGVRDERYK